MDSEKNNITIFKYVMHFRTVTFAVHVCRILFKHLHNWQIYYPKVGSFIKIITSLIHPTNIFQHNIIDSSDTL